MNNSMKKSFCALAALVLSAPVFAQNINQTVQVTNDYVTRFADFQKQGGEMTVPDSLYRFDYHFDYSVFDTPYKGSYEFSPYRIRVTPQARLYDGNKLYLRAGAGYSFHPQLELAWQMLEKKDFTIGVFADMGGYAGRYFQRSSSDTFRGYDLDGHVSVNGQALRPGARLSYQVGFDGIYNGWGDAYRAGFNSGYLAGRVQSRERPGDYTFYDVDLRFRHSVDQGNVRMSNLHVGISAGPVLKGKYKILMDGLFEMEAMGVYQTLFRNGYNTNLARLHPHVDFLFGPVRVDAGARFDLAEYDRSEQKPFTIAPDVMVRLAMLDADLDLYAGVSGGLGMEDHYSLKQFNHFVNASNTPPTVSREKIRIRAGLEGHRNAGLQYAFEAGYVSYSNKPLVSLNGMARVDYKSVYANATMGWKSERLDIDGALTYNYLMFPEEASAFAPAAFTADVRGTWNWQQKIFAGLFVEAATARKSMTPDVASIAGYANVGLTGEYRIDRNWSVWAEAGNLLGMAIERMPGYVVKGPYFTLGFGLRL